MKPAPQKSWSVMWDVRFAGITCVATALIVLTACESLLGPDDSPPPDLIQALPRPLTGLEAEALDASNEFAFRLFEEVRADAGEGENVLVSPLSVSLALGMAANGARGVTLEEIKAVLGTDDLTREEMNQAYRGLTDVLLPLDPTLELGIANSAWLREGFPVVPSFLQRIDTFFDAEGRELDFSAPDAEEIINGWVNEKTRGRISEIVDQVKPEDVFYLINTLYFKGSWRRGFDRGETKGMPFHLATGDAVDVPFMSREDMPGLYFHRDGIRIADLPYGGGAYSMTFVVPTLGTLADVLDGLTREQWDGWMAGLDENGFLVRLPRFDLETSFQLNAPLRRMGMERSFTARADFWDMVREQSDAVFIDRVRHKTFLQVDEEGTEAAGATFVGFVTVCDCGPPSFVVDRPFLLAIRERLTGTILFLGVVYDPR